MWIEWVGDERDQTGGCFCAWACGCTGQVEWAAGQPTRFRFEVTTAQGVTRGHITVAGGCARDEGVRRAQQAAEAVHTAHHGEE